MVIELIIFNKTCIFKGFQVCIPNMDDIQWFSGTLEQICSIKGFSRVIGDPCEPWLRHLDIE